MPTPDQARQIADEAVERAAERLGERGVDPARCGRLLEALRRGTEQAIAALELGRDVRDYWRFLDAVSVRLDADPAGDAGDIEPPRRRLAMRW